MFVCQCWAVTTRQIGAAINAGACTADEVAEHTCASTGCGSCREHLEAILAAHFGQVARVPIAA